MKKVLLKIDGMTCSACSSGLEKYLNKQDGIKEATVNLIMNNASVEYDESKLTLAQVEKFVEKAGFISLGIDNFDKEFEAIAGYGVSGKCLNGDSLLIGNSKLMEKNGIKIENQKDEQQLMQDGNSILFVSMNGNLVSLIGVKDTLKAK